MKLVLIGGGDIGRNNTKYETGLIDEEIVKMSGIDKPNFLFISLASNFGDSYYKAIKDIYKNLGCNTGKISNKTLTHMDVVQEKIKNADIIYVGGGDTVKLVSILKSTGMDKMLKSALERNCVMAGISAGAILWCKYGLSDTEIINNISSNYVKVDGLGYIDYMLVPHFSSDIKKKENLKSVLNENKDIKAICLDNCVALKIVDDKWNIIKSNKDANGYVCTYMGLEELK